MIFRTNTLSLTEQLQTYQSKCSCAALVTSVALAVLGACMCAGLIPQVGIQYGFALSGVAFLVGAVSLYDQSKRCQKNSEEVENQQNFQPVFSESNLLDLESDVESTIEEISEIPDAELTRANLNETHRDRAYALAARFDLEGEIVVSPQEIQVNGVRYQPTDTSLELFNYYVNQNWLSPEPVTICISARTNQISEGNQYLQALPLEMIREIIEYLPARDQLRMGACTSYFHHLIHSQFWKSQEEFSPKCSLTPTQLHSILCAYGERIEKLNLKGVLASWNRDEQFELLNLLPIYCPHLKSLNLEECHLRLNQMLIQTFSRFTQLTYLYLGANDNNYGDLHPLATTLGSFGSLVHLNLENNAIGIRNLSLLGDSLLNHPNLTHLNLSSNGFEAEGARILSDILPSLTCLSHLDLSNCLLNHADMRQLVSSLPLSLLHLNLNNSGLESLQLFAQEFNRLTSLQSLNLNGNYFPTGMQVFARNLPESLIRLDLGKNILRNQGVAYLAQEFSRLTNLLELNLEQNYLDAQGAQNLAASLSQLSLLTHLQIGKNNFEEQGIQFLISPLSHLSFLRHLDLSRTCLHAQGSHDLAQAIRGLTALNELILNENAISPYGIEPLAEAMSQLPIERLELAGNCLVMEENGAVILGRILQEMPLKILNLDTNFLTNIGLESLIPSLSQLSSLRELNLNNNQLGDEGLQLLSPLLLQLTSLERLYFCNNQISDEGRNSLLSFPLSIITSLEDQ